jgi:hypothetical protein
LQPEVTISSVEQWLELEEQLRHCLPPSLGSEALLHKLADALDGKQYLVGDGLSLADVAVYSTLLPALRQHQAS